MRRLPVRGHCLCGAISYEVSAEPSWSCHCHCSDCRRNTGGAVATFVGFLRQDFSLTSGDFAVYESSPGVRRSFCSRCGTPMAYEAGRYPGEIHLYLGTLEHPESYPAQAQVFCREQLPWFRIDGEGPCYATNLTTEKD